ncbi:hypothetical protein HO173_010338 [Letharia columbiana]|uniref:Uncharacterized protein n=1 Tax=Letharia columbiana TaxID=112416 RepID=A0A8H6L0Y1_9LECA|nr:uncharacterized protein HO173_010338 [Letharia columbiana]KAF6231378.1 hypothetical protein HO173_010338 [Letharia columbiana]
MSSPNSASAAIPPSSTHPSSSVRAPLTLDELDRYVCQEAFNRAELPVIPPTFIGPHPPPTSSTFIGTKYLVGGPTNETPVRIMFRCVSPHDKVSRHVLLKMKPSVPEEALALKLCEVFEIPATGGVITKTQPEFVPGLSPLRVPNKVYSYGEMFEGLGASMAGFVEVTVVPAEQMNICTNCGIRKTVNAVTLQNIRKWCFAESPDYQDSYPMTTRELQ